MCIYIYIYMCICEYMYMYREREIIIIIIIIIITIMTVVDFSVCRVRFTEREAPVGGALEGDGAVRGLQEHLVF